MRHDQRAERRHGQHEAVHALGADAEQRAEDRRNGAGDGLGRAVADGAGDDIDQRQDGGEDAQPEAAGAGDQDRGDGLDAVHVGFHEKCRREAAVGVDGVEARQSLAIRPPRATRGR